MDGMKKRRKGWKRKERKEAREENGEKEWERLGEKGKFRPQFLKVDACG